MNQLISLAALPPPQMANSHLVAGTPAEPGSQARQTSEHTRLCCGLPRRGRAGAQDRLSPSCQDSPSAPRIQAGPARWVHSHPSAACVHPRVARERAGQTCLLIPQGRPDAQGTEGIGAPPNAEVSAALRRPPRAPERAIQPRSLRERSLRERAPAAQRGAPAGANAPGFSHAGRAGGGATLLISARAP